MAISLVADLDDEDEVLGEVRRTVEKGLTVMAKMEKRRAKDLNDALKDLKIKQQEVRTEGGASHGGSHSVSIFQQI